MGYFRHQPSKESKPNFRIRKSVNHSDGDNSHTRPDNLTTKDELEIGRPDSETKEVEISAPGDISSPPDNGDLVQVSKILIDKLVESLEQAPNNISYVSQRVNIDTETFESLKNRISENRPRFKFLNGHYGILNRDEAGSLLKKFEDLLQQNNNLPLKELVLLAFFSKQNYLYYKNILGI